MHIMPDQRPRVAPAGCHCCGGDGQMGSKTCTVCNGTGQCNG